MSQSTDLRLLDQEPRPPLSTAGSSPRQSRQVRPAKGLGHRAGPRKLVATSLAMRELLEHLNRLIPSDISITLIGETGTGKDVLAHTIHDASPRRDSPFVVFDCAAVPHNLVESELFGHERGAFTGAHAEHAGAFERAHGGTLFLDEIGELPLELQPRLLRVLDRQAVRRVGGARDHHVDVRVVAATNRDLAAMTAAKTFRQDLYFRLAAAVFRVPALRERGDDFAELVPRLLSDLGRADVVVDESALAAFRDYSWPGNVRELKNVIACALAFVDGDVLQPQHIRFVAPASQTSSLDRLALGGHTLESLERAAIRQTLEQTRGNKAQAAKILGIAPSTLYEKLKTL